LDFSPINKISFHTCGEMSCHQAYKITMSYMYMYNRMLKDNERGLLKCSICGLLSDMEASGNRNINVVRRQYEKKPYTTFLRIILTIHWRIYNTEFLF